MFKGEIRGLCIRISVRFKDNDKKRNKELREIISLIDNDTFEGEKRDLKKLIRSFLKPERKKQ